MQDRDEHIDVAVIGAGFAGSLFAMLSRRLGLNVVLIERDRHPRFALGESSTPLCDLVLEDLCRRFDLVSLLPFCRYGPWKAERPDVVCGPKRGFSFFHHRRGSEFTTDRDHSRELIVGASPSIDVADTHWKRADVDAVFVEEAQRLGVTYLDGAETECRPTCGRHRLIVNREGTTRRFVADFVLDASGDAAIVARSHGARDMGEAMRTHSRLIYAHVAGLVPFGDVLHSHGIDRSEHPFPCDEAALHHVFDGGWMYALRFDDGVTSVGFSLDPWRFPDRGLDAEIEARLLIETFPGIGAMFQGARCTVPWRKTARLQRRMSSAAGPGWAALPAAFARIDPLFSTGNAHAVAHVERLIAILSATSPGPDRDGQLVRGATKLRQESAFIDRLVAAAFSVMDDFERFVATTMIYFAAATSAEARRREGRASGFLLADDEDFIAVATEALESVRQGPPASRLEAVRHIIAPFDVVGLADPKRRNLYPNV